MKFPLRPALWGLTLICLNKLLLYKLNESATIVSLLLPDTPHNPRPPRITTLWYGPVHGIDLGKNLERGYLSNSSVQFLLLHRLEAKCLPAAFPISNGLGLSFSLNTTPPPTPHLYRFMGGPPLIGLSQTQKILILWQLTMLPSALQIDLQLLL